MYEIIIGSAVGIVGLVRLIIVLALKVKELRWEVRFNKGLADAYLKRSKRYEDDVQDLMNSRFVLRAEIKRLRKLNDDCNACKAKDILWNVSSDLNELL